MTDPTNTATPQQLDAAQPAAQPTAQEVAELITEFETYRERLVNDTLDAAKRAKMSKKETMAKLEPELAKVDAALQQLRAQQAQLVADS
ncbi:MAG: hypothetical protein AAF152_19055 [Cyanobacteria bacterium P01_A01_bin.114]